MSAGIDQSVQLAPPAAGDFEMWSAAPGGILAGNVSRITGYRETRRGHFRQREAASLIMPLIVTFGEAFAIGLGRPPSARDRFGSFAAGLFAGPVVIDSFGAADCIQIDFTPLGARRFFRLPMHELADAMLPLDDVLGVGGIRLREQLGNAATWPERLEIARSFVAARLDAGRGVAEGSALAYQRLQHSGGTIPVARIAEHVGWSRKHLAQRFRDDFGLGPKTLSRMFRFNRALDQARRTGEDWARVAADCGYSDQAHLVREFRALGGATPTALAGRAA